jgi:broad specificity phosphatase PhoE
MEILLIRHGENKANITREFSCKTVDYALTEKGKIQAQQTAEALANLKIDKIVSSPLLRAKQTAETICNRTKSNFEVEEALREINVGDLELSPPTANAWKYYFEIINEWNRGNLDKRFAGGESGKELRERFHSVIKKQIELPIERLVLVGHTGIFLNGIAHLCELDKDIEFYADHHHNCSISKVEVSKHLGQDYFELKDWGNISHLYGETS